MSFDHYSHSDGRHSRRNLCQGQGDNSQPIVIPRGLGSIQWEAMMTGRDLISASNRRRDIGVLLT